MDVSDLTIPDSKHKLGLIIKVAAIIIHIDTMKLFLSQN